jgi:hypothetical protein
MEHKPPPPVCKAFLICRKIEGDTLTLTGPYNCHVAGRFPSGQPLSFFTRLRGGHGPCAIEVQLQDGDGIAVWRDGPPQRWSPKSPLDTFDLKMNLIPVFPAPGDYAFVLAVNDEELGREPFFARLPSRVTGK